MDSWFEIPIPYAAVPIFVNYRREDSSAIAGRIDDHLRAEFGDTNVYRDIDSIPIGWDFVEHLNRALDKCDVMVTIVGPHWLCERLSQDTDFVRLELEAAFARKIPVIPVLVEGGAFPAPKQLPPSLWPLLRRQAIAIESDSDFKIHIARLMQGIHALLPQPNSPQPVGLPARADAARTTGRSLEPLSAQLTAVPQAQPKTGVSMTSAIAIVAVSVALVVATFGVRYRSKHNAAPPQAAASVTSSPQSSSVPPTQSASEPSANVWLSSALLGEAIVGAPVKVVKILSTNAGYQFITTSPFQMKCGLNLGADGDPSLLTNCQSNSAEWSPESPIKLTCELVKSGRICTGDWANAHGNLNEVNKLAFQALPVR